MCSEYGIDTGGVEIINDCKSALKVVFSKQDNSDMSHTMNNFDTINSTKKVLRQFKIQIQHRWLGELYSDTIIAHHSEVHKCAIHHPKSAQVEQNSESLQFSPFYKVEITTGGTHLVSNIDREIRTVYYQQMPFYTNIMVLHLCALVSTLTMKQCTICSPAPQFH